jgi:beta-xylosidase
MHRFLSISIGLFALLVLSRIAMTEPPANPANLPAPTTLAWGDQGDGTYKNPILKSDYSDPDVIRVGDDFYLVASDFNYVGIQVLHSKDLVNWEIIGQVFNKLAMSAKYDQMKGYGEGTWAPSLRFHEGEFYLYVCTPHDGLFMWHTKDPAGPWSQMVTVKAIDLWEDPCPFWDDDGHAYLVHGHKGAGPLILHKMSADGTKLLDDGQQIYQGPTAEGPKMVKRQGYYYISLPEGGVGTGYQTVLRSKNIYGPYERKQVTPAGSPHQGGIVELDNGESWFIGFKTAGSLGRIDYLEPVKWQDDGWPIFGDNGNPVTQWKKPDVGKSFPIQRPQTSDEFTDGKLSPIWQWNHNPVDTAWSLTERPGWLRLHGLPAPDLANARNTLTEKIWDDAGTIDTKIDISHLSDGQQAGFTFISGNTFGWVGAIEEKGIRNITSSAGKGPVVQSAEIWLRGTYERDRSKLWYSLDGQNYVDTHSAYQLKYVDWKGGRFGVYFFGGTDQAGYADVDYVHYEYGATTGIAN